MVNINSANLLRYWHVIPSTYALGLDWLGTDTNICHSNNDTYWGVAWLANRSANGYRALCTCRRDVVPRFLDGLGFGESGKSIIELCYTNSPDLQHTRVTTIRYGSWLP